MYYAGINAVMNVILSIVLFPSLAHVGIAIATSISAWVNVVLLFVHLQMKGHWPLDGATLRRLFMMLAASIGMGAGLFWLQNLLEQGGFLEGAFAKALAMIGVVLVGMIIYFALCRLTGAVNFRQILANFRRTPKKN